MAIQIQDFGTTKSGKKASLYTIGSPDGLQAVVTDFGATLVQLLVPDGTGKKTDVVLGFDRLEDYEERLGCFGATVGRNANRISGACFTIDGQTYHVPNNSNGNNLHTDTHHGFHKKLWSARCDEEENRVVFSYCSPEGEYGFPGTLHTSVSYQVLPDCSLQITYDAVSDRKTLINLTNHSYFNLAGHDAGSICDTQLTILADAFTEVLPGIIPSGTILPVEGTAMDFRTPKPIGEQIDDPWEQLTLTDGYDHNFALRHVPGMVQKIAVATDPKTGRTMEVYTDLPGVQFYAGNSIPDQVGKGGARYTRRCAFCLETQYFPNNVNIPGFLQAVFGPGEPYHTTTIYKFL